MKFESELTHDQKLFPRWRINLYVLWFSQILSLAAFGFGFPFLPFYLEEIGVKDGEELKFWVGILNALPGLSLAIMAPVWGMVADKIGKKWMLIRAMTAAILVIGGMGLAQNVWQLAALRLAQGFFTGTVSAAAALVACGTPNKKLSSSLGFLSSSTFLGLTLGPALGGIVAASYGYRTSFFIGALIMSGGLLLMVLLVREPKMEQHEKCDNKGEGTHSSPSQNIKHYFPLGVIFLIAILFFSRLGRSLIPPYLPLHVEKYFSSPGATIHAVGILSAICAFVSAISAILAGRFAERFGAQKVVAFAIALSLLFSLPLFFLQQFQSFAVVFVFSIFAGGGIEPIVTSIATMTVPHSRRGAFLGVVTLAGSLGWMIAPLIGSVIAISFSTQTIFLIKPLFDLIALVVLAFYFYKYFPRCRPISS